MRQRALTYLSLAFALAATFLTAAGSSAGQQAVSSERVVYFPDPDAGVDSLDARAADQKRMAVLLTGLPSFRFIDRLPESGITFVNRVVEDAGRLYKAAHYDHGNGLAVADVDNDGLIDLYFTNQVGANELWRNLGGGRFDNVTDAAGVGLESKISVAGSFADIDNDGDEDLYVTTVNQGNVLFENLGGGRFRDISEASGLAHVGHSSGAVFFDYNRDGRLDLFLTNVGVYTTDEVGSDGQFLALTDAFSGHMFPERTEASILFENRGDNVFVDVSAERGLQDVSWSGDAAVADFNEDGFPDLYVANMQGDDHYYENVRGDHFVDRGGDLFPRTPWGTMGINVFDYDNDGHPDLLLTDMHSDMSVEVPPHQERLDSDMQWPEEMLQGRDNNIFGNAFYRNLGDGSFVEMSDALGVENYWPWGVSVGDVNADGYQDVFVASSMNFPFRYHPNTLLINVRGKGFVDSAFVHGVEPRRDERTHTRWFEFDCSGAESNQPTCEGREGVYTMMGTLGTRSAAFVDLDNDGDLDLVTNEFNAEPQVLFSDLADTTPVNFLMIRLDGTESNRDGFGAKVTVYAGDARYTQVHDGKSGYLSQSVQPLYFGLGEHAHADRVEVLWPSGKRQTVWAASGLRGALEIVENSTAPLPGGDRGR